MRNFMRRTLEVYEDQGLQGLGRKLRGFVNQKAENKVLDPARFWLWERGLLPFESVYEEDYYRDMLDPERLADVNAFCDVVAQRFQPESVIDFGCGTGRFLLPFQQAGVDVKGLDASGDALELSPVPDSNLIQHDLRTPFHPDRRYDLALCIEVLEHIPDGEAQTTVSSIARAGERAVVTAAPPGQGGKHHVNEQPRRYWKELFQEAGMEYQRDSVEEVRHELEAETLEWLTDNLMIFQSHPK